MKHTNTTDHRPSTHTSSFFKSVNEIPTIFKTKNPTNQNAPKFRENGVAGTGARAYRGSQTILFPDEFNSNEKTV